MFRLLPVPIVAFLFSQFPILSTFPISFLHTYSFCSPLFLALPCLMKESINLFYLGLILLNVASLERLKHLLVVYRIAKD